VGAGLIQVFVPRGEGLVIDGKISAGEAEVFGHQQSGTGVELHQIVAPATASDGTLTLHLEMGFGEVEVHHA
jgi:predicted membrane protein